MTLVSWEDLVFSNPDDVNTGAMFRDVRGGDERQQYEAATGLYWLANLRPGRFEDWEDDFVGLLGTFPDFTLNDEGNRGQGDVLLGTRGWAAEAVGLFLRTFPELIPRVLDLLNDADARTQEDASRALAYASGMVLAMYPHSEQPDVQNHLHQGWSTIRVAVNHENNLVAANALYLAAAVTSRNCADASALVPKIELRFPSGELKLGIVPFLKEVALCNPDCSSEITTHFFSFLDDAPSDSDVLFRTTAALTEIADKHPSIVEGHESVVRELAEHEISFVRKHAQMILDAIDDNETT